MSVAGRFITRVTRRQPDQVIPSTGSTYLRRWFLLPKNRFFNVYLHQFLRSDDDRALHDHPWLFNFSWLWLGDYFEHTIRAGGIHQRKLRKAGSMKFRVGPAPHRIELLTAPLDEQLDAGAAGTEHASLHSNLVPVSCWTVFITGPVVRPWGFHCPGGWVHSRAFGKKGCDQ